MCTANKSLTYLWLSDERLKFQQSLLTFLNAFHEIQCKMVCSCTHVKLIWTHLNRNVRLRMEMQNILTGGCSWLTWYNCTASGFKASIGVVASLLGFYKGRHSHSDKRMTYGFCAASCWYDGWHSPNQTFQVNTAFPFDRSLSSHTTLLMAFLLGFSFQLYSG